MGAAEGAKEGEGRAHVGETSGEGQGQGGLDSIKGLRLVLLCSKVLWRGRGSRADRDTGGCLAFCLGATVQFRG